jgi:hypothetical protein
MAEVVIAIPHEVDALLEEMRLDRAGLVTSVRFAASEFTLCTENDAVGFPNMVAYDKAGRRLRELYLPKGWIRDNSNNQVAIKNDELKLRIVPCNFDEHAGNPNIRPANRSPKGEVSRKKALCNRTAWLPGFEPSEPLPDDDGYLTWLLGIYIEHEKPIGAELSFPTDFKGDYFTQLAKRILLMFGDDDDRITAKTPNTDDTFGEIEIEVKRK